jgi:heptaprenylglyceryl phosphate synthase
LFNTEEISLVDPDEEREKMKEIKEKYKDDDTQYEGTEYGGPDRLTREQAQEILENIKYRKANKLT